MDMIPGLIIATILGLGWGSFATMAMYRLPNGMPWIGKKPFCPTCKHDLIFRDYVSVISFLTRRGHCRYCGVKYGRRGLYLYTEIATAVLFIISFLVVNMSEDFLLLTALGTALVVLSAIEYEHQKLQPKILLFIWMLALVVRAKTDGHIYGILTQTSLAALVGLCVRHVVFGLQGRFKQSTDYLQYKEQGRFSGEGFSYVILFTISAVWIGVIPAIYLYAAAFILHLLARFMFKFNMFSGWFGVCWMMWLWYY